MVEFTLRNTGGRYDALGIWPAGLCRIDPETNISKEISDEEVQASCAEVRSDISDPDGRWLLKKVRTNQTVSALIRGASQLGYSRQAFNPQTYIERGQGPKEMHFSCLGLLNELIPKVTGYTMYSLIRPAPSRQTAYLYIDPVGVVLTQSLKDTSADTLAFLVDHDVQVPAKFLDKITKHKIDAETNPQHHTKRVALKHLSHADFMGEGQQSIMDTAVTPEECTRVARPAHPKAAPSTTRDDYHPAPRNVNYWLDKGKGKGKWKGKNAEEQAQERSSRGGGGGGGSTSSSSSSY